MKINTKILSIILIKENTKNQIEALGFQKYNMKYFYLIKKDDSILEIPYSEQAYKGAMEQFIANGNIIVRPMGYEVPMVLNASRVAEIMPEDIYDKFTKTTRAKMYIKNGTWYDTKEHRFVENEQWKQQEVDNTKRLNDEHNRPLTNDERERSMAKRKEVAAFLKEHKII